MELKGLSKFDILTIQSPKIGNTGVSRLLQQAPDTFTRSAQISIPAPTKVPVLTATNPLTNLYSPDRLLRAFANQSFLEKTVRETPEIQRLMADVGITNPVVDVRNVTDMFDGHLKTTTEYALAIAEKMGCCQGEIRELETAAKLHDIGKVLIPREIITSTSRLSNEERTIINTHAEAGKLLLQKSKLSQRVLDLIAGHHTPGSQDKLCQILTAADITSALKEVRSYKSAMPDSQVVRILEDEAKNSKFPQKIVGIVEEILATKPHI